MWQEGKLYIYGIDGDTITELKKELESERELTVVEYSSEGAYLATANGSMDIAVYETTEYEVWYMHACVYIAVAEEVFSGRLYEGRIALSTG